LSTRGVTPNTLADDEHCSLERASAPRSIADGHDVEAVVGGVG